MSRYVNIRLKLNCWLKIVDFVEENKNALKNVVEKNMFLKKKFNEIKFLIW